MFSKSSPPCYSLSSDRRLSLITSHCHKSLILRGGCRYSEAKRCSVVDGWDDGEEQQAYYRIRQDREA